MSDDYRKFRFNDPDDLSELKWKEGKLNRSPYDFPDDRKNRPPSVTNGKATPGGDAFKNRPKGEM